MDDGLVTFIGHMITRAIPNKISPKTHSISPPTYGHSGRETVWIKKDVWNES
jgi:hypothetical protein